MSHVLVSVALNEERARRQTETITRMPVTVTSDPASEGR
jgi:hypothetical protein